MEWSIKHNDLLLKLSINQMKAKICGTNDDTSDDPYVIQKVLLMMTTLYQVF